MRLKGGPELLALLDQLPKKIGNNAVRGGARAGAVVVRGEARNRIRRRSGQAAKTLKVSSRIEGDIVTAKVTMKGKHSFVGPFLEYGVAPHLISVSDVDRPTHQTRRGERKASIKLMNRMVKRGSLVIGGKFVGPYVQHPGHGAHPFMRPALDAKASEAIEKMGEYIRSRLSWRQLQAPSISVEPDEE
jgi:HK97 gp10 family phage protein